MKNLSPLLILMFACFPLFANELSGIQSATQSREYAKLRETYKTCVLAKGKSYAKVSTVTEAVTYAPIACKRELLKIKQYLLAGAFRIEVIDQLIESVKEGVEIDLVIEVYEVKAGGK